MAALSGSITKPKSIANAAQFPSHRDGTFVVAITENRTKEVVRQCKLFIHSFMPLN